MLKAFQATRWSRPSLESLDENIRSRARVSTRPVRQATTLVGPVSLGEVAQGPKIREIRPPKGKETYRVVLGIHL